VCWYFSLSPSPSPPCPVRVCNNFQSSWSVLTSNEKVLLLGLIQSCFESAMFIFVFMWTPAMEATLPQNTAVSGV
jgi:hypothetical protein